MQQLKDQITKYESVLQSLQDCGCAQASVEVQTKLARAHSELMRRKPAGTRINQATHALRKAAATREKAAAKVAQLTAALAEANTERQDATVLEQETAKELQELKASLAETQTAAS